MSLGAVIEFDLGRARHEEIDIQDISLLRVDVTRNGWHEARDISRAASHAKPRAARVLSIRFQRIRVEKALAIEGNPRQQAVIEGAFHDIDVLGVTVEEEQTLIPKSIGHRRAGFAVGAHVGQEIVRAKSLAPAERANAASDVDLFADNVLPNDVDSF